MSGSRPRSSNSVSLFPFLAVLVCAMGALIFLLIVTTRRIRSEARARAVAEREETPEQPTRPQITQPELSPEVSPEIAGAPPARIPKPTPPDEPERIQPIPGVVELGPSQSSPVLPPKIELPPPPEPEPIWPAAIAEKPAPPDPNVPLRKKRKELQAARQKWLAAVKKKEQTAEKLKSGVEELTAKLRNVNSQIEDVAEKRMEGRKTERELKQSRQRLLGQIAKVEQEIDDAKNRRLGEPTKFQVVPFDGHTGTNYRPIIIECTAEGMRFQPEGVVLTMDDFDGFTMGKNPLLAGAKALSDYWMQVSRRSDGEEPAPYVLMIVRPSGAKYFAAKKLLEALDRPFGYELVEEDLPIEIPPADPTAAKRCRDAVERLLKERGDLKKMLAAHGPQMMGRNPNYRVIRKPGGGFDVEYAPGGEGGGRIGGRIQQPGDDLPKTDRYGQPYRDFPGDDSGDEPSPRSQSRQNGQGSGDKRFPHTARNSESSGDRRFPRPFGNGEGEESTRRDPSHSRSGEGRSGNRGFLPERSESGPGGRRRDPREPRLLPEEILDRSQGNRPYRSEEGLNKNKADRSGNANAKRPNSDSSNTIPDDGGTNRNSPGNRHDNSQRFSGEPEQERADSEVGRDSESNNSSTNPNTKPRQSTNAGRMNPPKTQAGQTPSVETNSPRTSRTPRDRESPSQQTPAAGSSGQPGTRGPTTQPPMPDFFSLNSRRSMNQSEQSEPYQRRWGLSDPRANIGFEREIKIRVEANRLVVGNAFAVSYNEKTTDNQLAAGMLKALELTVRKWGRPPMSFYWIPTVRFEVGAATVPVYQKLNQTAKAWGLETSAEAIEN